MTQRRTLSVNPDKLLVDDRPNNGADPFDGELILFESDLWPNWRVVAEALLAR